MSGNNYLLEAFKEMDILNEDTFTLDDSAGIEKLKNFIDGDTIDTTEVIIDPDADTVDDLEDSYLGKVILDCQVCHSQIYKDGEDIVLDDDEKFANADEECPYCHTTGGFKIIGQVAEYTPEADADVTADTKAERGGEEGAVADDKAVKKPDVDESLAEAVKARRQKSVAASKKKVSNKSVKEDFQKVEIETDTQVLKMSQDGGKVTVETETKAAASGEAEMITPIDPDVEREISSNNKTTAELTDEGDYEDADIEEFDEDEFDELGESYLKKVYENVKSFKTTSGSLEGNKLRLEGIITFNSNKKAQTKFIFESHTKTKTGKYKLIGENAQISNNKKAFTITGSINNKKFIAESFTYNYAGKDAKTGGKKRVYGTVSKNK